MNNILCSINFPNPSTNITILGQVTSSLLQDLKNLPSKLELPSILTTPLIIRTFELLSEELSFDLVLIVDKLSATLYILNIT